MQKQLVCLLKNAIICGLAVKANSVFVKFYKKEDSNENEIDRIGLCRIVWFNCLW